MIGGSHMLKNIIPIPKEIEELEGVIDLPLSVCADACFEPYIKALIDSFEKMFGKRLSLGEGIRLAFDGSLAECAYRIDSTDGVTLYASAPEGLYYAMASLLLWVNKGSLTLERAKIFDYPDKPHRALFVDLARAWHPARTVHQYIELCFILKARYLHLHFMDDHGYTLPSRKFPRVTDGYRHYSFEEIDAMVIHARERGIIIIPEFEVPGHASVLIKNYPEVFGNTEKNGKKTFTVDGKEVSGGNIICAGSERSFSAVKDILSEVCEMFPDSPYIHIGGDEAKIKVWGECSECLDYMKKKGIEDVYELYSEFVGRVADHVISLGRVPMVWEGFPEKGIKHIPKETVVMVWDNGYHSADRLVEEGFRIINTAWKPLYIVPDFDRRWGIFDILSWNVCQWQHFSKNSPLYDKPLEIAPTDSLLGAQLCAWESTFEEEIGRTTDCLFAFSERLWNECFKSDEEDFAKRTLKTIWNVSRFIQDV